MSNVRERANRETERGSRVVKVSQYAKATERLVRDRDVRVGRDVGGPPGLPRAKKSELYEGGEESGRCGQTRQDGKSLTCRYEKQCGQASVSKVG